METTVELPPNALQLPTPIQNPDNVNYVTQTVKHAKDLPIQTVKNAKMESNSINLFNNFCLYMHIFIIDS